MARIRSIKPDFCSSADVGALGREARLFFLQILTEADDEGRMLWIPRRLCGVLYPYDVDVTHEQLDAWAGECETRGMVIRYMVANVTYLAIANWGKHQKISHATESKFPAPPNSSGSTPEILRSDSGIPPETFRPDMEREREGEQGKEKEGADAPKSIDPDKAMWDAGKALLGNSSGALLGKLVKEHGKGVVMQAIATTTAARPADPKTYLVGVLKKQSGPSMAEEFRRAI